MLRNYCKIVIGGKYVIDFVNNIKIESSFETLTDTCTIIVPRKLKFQNKPIIIGEDSLFKVGDSVSVTLGYWPKTKTLFEGFITGIKPGKPVEIKCEDAMWLFKQTTFTKSWRSLTLGQMLDELIDVAIKSPFWINYQLDVDDTLRTSSLGKFVVNNGTPAQVFELLRKNYGFYTFVRNHTIYCGLAYYPKLRSTGKFVMGENIIKNDLEYQSEKDVKIKIKATSILPNSKKIEVEVGDGDGAVRSLFFYNLDKESLTKIATQNISKYKYSGYKGSFETFGYPFIQHGDACAIVDKYTPERSGEYLAKKVVYSFGMDGYRQEITLDQQIK
jgi:hypothetical protein